ncbi:MAG TPA: sigma-70 family RNA polymerase sigma factor [Anaerolineaceae bacterium]|nr:sigma-70 family RNA polymerase sigma factor [Anaerolineaceae bacterium]
MTDFAALYDQLYPRIFAYVRLRCGDTAAAEDLTSQVFARALAALDSYHSEKASFATWLFSIAHNAVNNHYRAQAIRRWLPWEAVERHPHPDPVPEECALQNETRRELLEALSNLSPRERGLLALKFGGGLSNIEIAEVLGLNPNQVGVILYRAVDRLRERLAGKEIQYG